MTRKTRIRNKKYAEGKNGGSSLNRGETGQGLFQVINSNMKEKINELGMSHDDYADDRKMKNRGLKMFDSGIVLL